MHGRRKIRLIHTSDTHLGDSWSPGAAERALTAVVDGVHTLAADALLIAGDVFDNARIPDSLLEFFVAEMKRVAVPAIILPGNHDLYDAGSLYRRAPFESAPPNLHIIRGTNGETIRFESLTLDVWGRAMDNHTPSFRPLAGMRATKEDHWLVAMAHGHFHFPDDTEQRSSPIYGRQVAEAPCHYLALGHWERFEDVSQGDVTAFYSGSPMGAASQRGEVAVNVVDFDPEESPPVNVSQTRFPITP
jgi:DNA repair exonuclease SbcCD nuclease subunit